MVIDVENRKIPTTISLDKEDFEILEQARKERKIHTLSEFVRDKIKELKKSPKLENE